MLTVSASSTIYSPTLAELKPLKAAWDRPHDSLETENQPRKRAGRAMATIEQPFAQLYFFHLLNKANSVHSNLKDDGKIMFPTRNAAVRLFHYGTNGYCSPLNLWSWPMITVFKTNSKALSPDGCFAAYQHAILR